MHWRSQVIGCGGAITVVSGGYGNPRYGCQRASKQGAAVCGNRLTIRANVADTALLAGLRGFLLENGTIDYLTSALSTRLNALIDERPRLRSLKVAEREMVQRKLQHLVGRPSKMVAPRLPSSVR